METNRISVSGMKSWSHNSIHTHNHGFGSALLGGWYRFAAPPMPPISAIASQREKARHGRLASIAVPFFMLFLLALLPQMLAFRDFTGLVALLAGLVVCCVVLFLNRQGFVKLAGVLTLILLYTGGSFSMLTYPGGLTLSNIYILDYTILPDLVVLAFFSANSLTLVFCLNVIQIGLMVVFGHHDADISRLLHTSPLEIFAHLYLLQFITTITLYLWARSAEKAIARADRAEEIIEFEKREKKLKEQELAKKHRLDAGIQQILQTHVAVANGDLTVRAPLHQDHELWQVAAALNNLIARLHSLSLSERELKRKIQNEDERIANGYRKPGQTTSHMQRLPKMGPHA